jgi:hypothetical protein
MKHFNDRTAPSARSLTIAVVLGVLTLAFTGSAFASSPQKVGLGTADSFALVAAAGISDAPTSTIQGDVGLSPAAGTFYTGLTCAEVSGAIYAVNAAGPAPCVTMNPGLLTTVTQAVTDSYDDAFGRSPDTTYVGVDNQLGGGQTLVPGVYRFPAAATANLIGNVTLAGDADSVWIFQATSSLITAGSSTVTLTGGAQACNVFWQVGSSATIGGSSTLVGTVIANTSISVLGAATVNGRLFAGAKVITGAITLLNDTIRRPSSCTSIAQAAAIAAAAAEQARNAENVAKTAAENAIKDAAAAQAAAVAKAAADTQALADIAAKAAADAKAAAASAAKAAALRDVKAAKAAAAKAVALAKVAAKARAKAVALTASRNLARPARRHVGLTG